MLVLPKSYIEDGTEENIQAMLPDKLPSDIQKLYDASHEQLFR